jgi:(3S)-malyl-CoA thioesterase
MARPYRSALYIPGSKERALQKAQTLPCDAILFDLEDAVTPEEKPAARALLAETLKTQTYGARARIVRINAGAIATHPRLAGMVMGTNDLAKELGARFRADRLPMQAGLGLCLLAAKAHGLTILDGVYNAFKDDEGLRFECEQGRDMGFDGKTLIHPAQLEIANAAFAPSEAEIAVARRQIAAFEAAKADGQGVAVVDGKIVENLHIVTATAILAKAAAIAAMED